MAWFLSIAGADFWHFNAMELFATIAILVGASIAIYKWRKEKRRQDALIEFPGNWSANYNKNKKVVDFRINTNVLIDFHSYNFRASISAGGKHLHTQNVDSGQPMGNNRGQIFLTGEIPISEFPESITELEIQATITLDGEIEKSSEKRKLSITGKLL